MKKIFTTILLATALTMSTFAVTVSDVAGIYHGDLNISGKWFRNKDVYVLPGVNDNSITFVLPDFTYNAGNLGDIVLTNIPMDANGQLTLEGATLYLNALQERATITVLNDLHDGNDVYNSVLSESSAMVVLSIVAPSVLEPIFVLFTGNKVTDKNYALTNGGFEGDWSNNEAPNWHSFPSATGDYASMAGGDDQFKQSNDVRPGSTGSHSVFLASNLIAGVKANGNCTNGQVNAGSMIATDASGNYNFSDPTNSGYNTPFVGTPDSLVFWAKYIPADKNPNNEVNKARVNAVITTNARYQDPESSTEHTNAKIGAATLNYAAGNMDWQRLAVPFEYTSSNPEQAAYILVTFSTNKTPGGGSTYSEGGFLNKTYYYDNLYLDDAEIIYNHALSSLTMDNEEIKFKSNTFTSSVVYNDSTHKFIATTNGKTSKSFIGYNHSLRQVYIYVVPGNYSQQQNYTLYTLQMAAPPKTAYKYSASICDNELPYSDELFSDLNEAGTYKTTIRNTQGGDSIVKLTLSILPTYEITKDMTIKQGDQETWEGYDLSTYEVGNQTLTAEYKSISDCDSVMVLNLTIEPKQIETALPENHTKRFAQKIIDNGHLYIIREDESEYDVLGRKIK